MRSGVTAIWSRSWRDEPGTDGTPDVAARSEAAEQMRSVLKRIATLPRQQQDVVALCVWSGLSYEEAAAALGVPVGTVRSRLSRARASLDSPWRNSTAPRDISRSRWELERIAER